MKSETTTRRRLASATALAPSTISEITSGLRAEGLIDVIGKRSRAYAGRREEFIARRPEAACALCIHYTTDAIVAGAVDFGFSVHHESQHRIDAHSRADLTGHIVELLENLRLAFPNPACIVLSLPNHRFDRMDVARSVAEQTDVPVYTLNNVEALAVHFAYEHRAGAPDTFALVYVGAGVGSALVIDGELYQGVNGNASDIGHVFLRDSAMVCRCGRTGCLETFASERFIADRLSRLVRRDELMSRDELYDYLSQPANLEDGTTLQILDSVASDLAIGVYNFTRLVDPGHIVFLSRLESVVPSLATGVRAHFYQRAIEPWLRNTTLEFVSYVPDSGLIGAGIFGFERHFRDGCIPKKPQKEGEV
jgi:predicted NBD/HSP70 family sugar kinase